mgnify:CR=1 FL=1
MRGLLVALVFSVVSFAAQADELVLVGSDKSNWKELTSFELRKLFLGMPVERGQRKLLPIRNESSEDLDRFFLKVVVGMRPNTYQRKLLRNQLNYAIQPPVSIYNLMELNSELEGSKDAVSYVWRSSLDEENTGLHILQVIWRPAL